MDDSRVLRIKQYVLARLRADLADAPRGAQARLARRLGVSGAHLSNMLSRTPSRQPGEDFRRRVATHWGVSYAQLEALALGEETATPRVAGPGPEGTPLAVTAELALLASEALPPNLARVSEEYCWLDELPDDLRVVVRAQARQHYVFGREDLPREEWQRIMTGLERAALALVAHRQPARRRSTH